MKIAMYVPAWPPGNSANGIVAYASYMIPALRNLGHDVFILTWDANDTGEPRLSLLKTFQKPLPFWNRALFKLPQRARSITPRLGRLPAPSRDLVDKTWH